jgi:colanic acid biosynthesis glycosyl transferase WcaI
MKVANSASMKIMLVTQWFDPEPTFKGLAFAKALQARGHEVSVVTGFPNYPGGKIYPGYKLQLHRSEVQDGVRVKRLFLYPSHDGSGVGRALNYISFFLSVLTYLIIFAPRVDVIYVYHPPATVGVAVALAQFFRRTPTLLDVQDMWPDTLSSTGMINNKFLLKIIRSVCAFTYSYSSHIVVLSNGFKNLLTQRDVSDRKITVIPNWADIKSDVSRTPITSAMDQVKGFKFLFAGNMGPAQNLDGVIDAALLLSRQPNFITIFLLGEGIETAKLKERCESLQLKNIVFLPRVTMSQVGSFLAKADCLLVHLKADPLFAITIPSKTQAYLLSGKPILMAVEGDAADMVKSANAGFCVQPGNANELAKAMTAISVLPSRKLKTMGVAGKLYYEKHLSMEVGVVAFEKVFLKLAKRSSAGIQNA